MGNSLSIDQQNGANGQHESIIDEFLDVPGFDQMVTMSVQNREPAQQPVVNEPREPSINDTTFQRTEYTQQHIDEEKVKCSICFDDFVLGENLVQCPQCSHLFHEHCILFNIKSRNHTCPLCRYNLVENVNTGRNFISNVFRWIGL